MALSPLCRQELPPQGVLGHAAKVIGQHTPDMVQRTDLLTTLGIFGKLTYPALDVFQLIGRREMQESKFYQEIQEEAHVEMARQYILDELEARFGSQGPGLATALNDITDSKRLNRLHRLALHCASLEQFRDRFPKSGRHTHRRA
jgi:predicted transposase YdaD